MGVEFELHPSLESALMSLISIYLFYSEPYSIAPGVLSSAAVFCAVVLQVLLAMSLLSRTTNLGKSWFLAVFSLGTETQSSAMVILVSRAKDLPWRISMKQVYQKLMVRWLPALVCLMVSLLITTCHNLYVPLLLYRWMLIFFIYVFLIILLTVQFRSWWLQNCRIP